MKLNDYENLKTGDMLVSKTWERDPVFVICVNSNTVTVQDAIYNDDLQDYEPDGRNHLLTISEIMSKFDIERGI